MCVDVPEEAVEEGKSSTDLVDKLLASLYGARDASANWQVEVSKSMKQRGSKMGRYNPCTYLHKGRGLRCLVHGDVFVCAGGVEDLECGFKRD